jgi:protease-4
VLTLLVRLAGLVFWALLLPLHAIRRLAARVPRGTYLVLEVDGAIAEAPSTRRVWPASARRAFSLHDLTTLIDEAARDPRVRGLLVVIKSIRGGFATATSFRQALQNARTKGKHVAVHLPYGGGTKEAYVGVVADRVILGPQAAFAPVGVLSSMRYVRGALDRAGIVPEVHARGRYKTAAEAFEKTTMSDAQSEQLGALLDGLHAEIVSAISSGRAIDVARARSIIDNAPYVGEEAVHAGLADDVAYEDEVPSRLSDEGRSARLRRADTYFRGRTALRPRALASAGAIAVVSVHGTIVDGVAVPFGALAPGDRIIAAVRRVRAHPLVRGVVLHVDSPGGSALASDRIHHELSLLAAQKPLVACMGDVAASGGYYVSAAAHEIVAQPMTITGSIGVIGARFVIDPLLARLGIVTHVLQRGAHARLQRPLLALDADDKRAIDREIERIYQAFLRVVAVSRGRSVSEIEPLAQGRVWLGGEAHRNGLVDRLGGLDSALEAVRSRIGRGAARLRVVAVHPPRRPSPFFFEGTEPKAMRVIAHAIDAAARGLDFDASILALVSESVLAWCPSASTLRTDSFISS